jgi:hypothetical protein
VIGVELRFELFGHLHSHRNEGAINCSSSPNRALTRCLEHYVTDSVAYAVEAAAQLGLENGTLSRKMVVEQTEDALTAHVVHGE